MGAFNGSGTFVRTYSWANDKLNGINITASRFDTEDTGFASGLSNCVCKDGQQTTTAKIPFAVGIAVNQGSVSAPPISFTGDVSTGFYQSATGQLLVGVSGVKVATFNSNGLDATVIGGGTPVAGSFTTITGTSAVLNGSGSGSTTVVAASTASGTLTLPAATDTLVGAATTNTLTNKTYDTAGTGNVFKINGTAVSAVQGTGAVVLATSPTITTAALGSSTATTQSAGDNSTKLATTAYVDRISPFSTQNVVTGSRLVSTVYRNTTGKTMFVNVVITFNSNTTVSVFSDSSSSPSTTVCGFGQVTTAIATFSFMVLNNNYYEVAPVGSVTLDSWIEWN